MLFTGFFFGLISSLHCIGMCGPIAMMLPLDHNNPTKKTIQILLYHLGRITTYSFLGLLFGLLGKGFQFAGVQQQLSIFVGVCMILIAIVPEKKLSKYLLYQPILIGLSKVKSSLSAQFKKKSPQALFTIGVLNGFLPCGMVYAALFGALAMQNVFLGVNYMFLYGLGTIPLLTTFVFASHYFTAPMRNKFQKLIPVFLIVIGCLFVLRGLGLDLAYISPSNLNLFVKADANCHN